MFKLSTTQRYHHLDALRSFCMLFGIFVHAATLGDFGIWEKITFTSDYFRMATFFLASGILAALVLKKRSAKDYVTNRMQSLGVPLLAGLILLNPLTLWLVFSHHNPDSNLTFFEVMSASFNEDKDGLQGPLIWHLHLWFLFSLLAMSALAPPVVRLLCSQKISNAVTATARWLPVALHGLALAIATLSVIVAIRILIELTFPSLFESWLIRATLIYIPIYWCGILIYTQPTLWQAVNRIDFLIISAAGLALLAAYLLSPYLPESLKSLMGFIVINFVRIAAAFTLVAVFAKIASAESKVTSLVTSSIYTVYLLHFLLLYALAAALAPFGMALNTAYFLLVSISAIALGLAAHWAVVDKVPLLTFLFNGKRTKPKIAAKD